MNPVSGRGALLLPFWVASPAILAARAGVRLVRLRGKHGAVEGVPRGSVQQPRGLQPLLPLLALAILRQEALDLRLPRLDGYQVCQRLKADPTTAHMPIIMITAFLTGPSDTVRGIEYGADDYLNKPVDLDVLAARVRMILRRVQR